MMRGLGSSYVELKVDPTKLPALPRDPNRPETCFLVDEMQLQGSTGMTSEFFPEESQKKFEELIDTMKAVLDNANDVVGDPNSKKNLKRILANVSEVTDQAKRTLEELQKFFVAGTEASEELSETVAELRQILAKVNSGQGTAGKVISDPRLYDAMVESAEQSQMLFQEIRLLVDKIRERGLLRTYK